MKPLADDAKGWPILAGSLVRWQPRGVRARRRAWVEGIDNSGALLLRDAKQGALRRALPFDVEVVRPSMFDKAREKGMRATLTQISEQAQRRKKE
jgi:hypothetical protein